MKLSIILASLLFWQAPPPGMPQAQAKKGSIAGRVVRIGTGESIAGARVTVQKLPPVNQTPGAVTVAPPPGPNIGSVVPPAMTDSEGRFILPELEAGSYRLNFAANGYARQEYGQRVFGAPGTPVNVAGGEAVKDIVARLIPAGGVNGRVSDDLGRPAVGAQVQLLKASYSAAGQRTFQSAGSTRTNDRGEYRLFWVTPGRYFLNAGSTQSPVSANLELGAGESRNGIQESYSPSYYPGTADISAASVIEIQAGVELSAIDLSVNRQQLFKIRGQVIDSRTGQHPAGASISLSSRGLTGGGMTTSVGQSYNAATGTFEAANVAPGTYVVAAQIQDPGTPSTLGIGGPPRPMAMATVTVAGSDVDGITLAIAQGASVPGRLRVEGRELTSVAGYDRLRIQLSPPAGTPGVQQTPQFQAANADGTFREDNVMPGEYRINVVPMPVGFYLKEARYDQTDVLNKPLQFSGQVSGPIDIVLSPNAAQIDGTLLDDKDKPKPGIQVVLIPDQHRERVDLYKTAIADPMGHFSFRSVPPGDYRIYAWEALEQFGYFDSDLVQKYEPQGKSIHVSESDKASVEVRVIP